ncbi:ABC transporter permease [Pseudoclavibacter endophyticus]|uniref:ABC transporter permease subunit n=1 Tax=Pseudoclavibacter endophyticus TaxID=1778590 RepID=A0A6H9WJ19_9MICO|nr:ABC transporter permease subunit [Pseudoclavibacter endophyticus]KAB1648806.1 ABC transporter permease subunit [Pseudoclavibacter endophyticus]GGA68368.1 ABC transporter permease [Pseudoclavibacter endophyticus]
MDGFDVEGFFVFIGRRWEEILTLAGEHLAVVLLSVAIAAVIGIGLGMIVWDRPAARSAAVTTAAIAITVPSLALLALLSPVLGLGWGATIVALVVYALLPIVRNTAVGLGEVPRHVLEAASGVGMSRTRILVSMQLPIAWPVILTGMRVATQLSVGVAAIAAYVAGPGLGTYIFRGLATLGSKNALNFALVGTLATIVIALLLDALFVLLARSTTSKGLR